MHSKKLSRILLNSKKSPFLPITSRSCQFSRKNHVHQKCTEAVDIEKKELYSAGDKIHGYTVLEVSDVADFHAQATHLRHDRTGAEHLHVARDDQNNVFSVALRTTPLESTGVAHILEHLALCGSKRFPVRDPFFKMLNRSLSTFMNAMTACDWTMYPFSTQNRNDYNNLMSIYLDAVFYPSLKENDFRQEGWRLDHEDLTDPNSDIIFKGVVFNEMKGVFSNAETVFQYEHQNCLLPGHTYGFNSGGDPAVIPQLTWEHLKDFHACHYHPSNARFYTYGSFPLEDHLEKINSDILQNFEKISTDHTSVIPEQKWTAPRRECITCAHDPMLPDPEKQNMASVSFVMDCTDDPFEYFTLGILSVLLVSGPNSAFYQALLEPNIGSEYTPGCGIDTSTRNPTFSVGLQGIREEDADRVVEIIEQTLNKVVEEGFDSQRIDSILHSVELQQKHQSKDFGLNLIMAIVYRWSHDQNPINMLHINELVDKFKATLSDNPSFLTDKVRKCFIENTHKLILTMKPENDFNLNKEKNEAKLLQEKISALSDEERNEVYDNGLLLEQQQNAIEDISSLPIIKIQDIDKEIRRTDIEISPLEGVNIQTTHQPTNGISYFRSIVTTASLKYILKPYLPLFCNVVTKLGAGNMDYKQLSQQMELTTGGLSMGTHVSADHTDPDHFEMGISFASHCLDRNVPQMFSLWQDVLNEPCFSDMERLRTLVTARANELAMSVPHAGHSYAMTASAASLSPSASLNELFGGFTQVSHMKEVAERGDLDEIRKNFMQSASYLFNLNEMRCSLNSTSESMGSAVMGLQGLLSNLQSVGFDDPPQIELDAFRPKHTKRFIQMDLPVNYVSRSVRTVPYTHPDTARLQILSKLLSAKFLHKEIREKGGAYGGGARSGDGVFSFFSYRDPNTEKTLDAFDRSVAWACEASFSDEDIDEAKLSVFAAVDSPVAPATRGMALFRGGISDDMRQTHRDRLFRVDRDQLVDVAQRYLIGEKQVDSFAIIGPKCENLDSSWTIENYEQMS